MLEVNTDHSTVFKREFKNILGMKFLVNTYKDYVHVLKKFRNKYAVGFTWATTPGDNWYMEKPGDRPYIWTHVKPIKLNQNQGILVRHLYCGRLRIGFAKQYSLVPSPISEKAALFQDMEEYPLEEISHRVVNWRGTIEVTHDSQDVHTYIRQYNQDVIFKRKENGNCQ